MTNNNPYINMTVEDLRGSLHCSMINGDLDIDELHEALLFAVERKEKTKQKIINSYIVKLQKSRKEQPCSQHSAG